MPTVDELRSRLGVGAETPDTQLGVALDVAEELVRTYLPEQPTGWGTQTLVDEAVLQLAVKVWEVQPRGGTALDLAGGFDTAYNPTATAGLVRSVWAYIQAAHPAGGLTV